MQKTARQIALLDCLCSLSYVASANQFVRPEINEDGVIDIKEGRHPVVEKMMNNGMFISNDTYLNNFESRISIITGPNMAGKSTYMRQTALIVLMAQIGSFVPAASANIGICDRIFTRVGASDDLASGQSTFMVEMSEVANILRNATKNSLLILDEIQCGMGRTGEMFAWQHYGVKPDIMTSAKALGCGVPVGAFLMTERVAEKSLAPGDHGTTYGGNPFVGAAVDKVLEMMERDHITEHVKKVAPYLEKKLDELVAKHDFLTGRRGLGLMQGVVCEKPVGQIAAKALEAGLIVITAGSNVLRFVPPLIIKEKDVDEMISRLESIL